MGSLSLKPGMGSKIPRSRCHQKQQQPSSLYFSIQPYRRASLPSISQLLFGEQLKYWFLGWAEHTGLWVFNAVIENGDTKFIFMLPRSVTNYKTRVVRIVALRSTAFVSIGSFPSCWRVGGGYFWIGSVSHFHISDPNFAGCTNPMPYRTGLLGLLQLL